MRPGLPLVLALCLQSAAAQQPAPAPWGDFVEPDFPFFSSVLDARQAGEGLPKNNLTPRGLILNLGHNLWACFDTDLLRLACVWESEPGKLPVTPDALAPGSYHVAGQKTRDGQTYLPKPVGQVWLANGIYPGWQAGDKPSFTDPREPAPSPEEVGRGSLPDGMGRLLAVHRDLENGVTTLELDIAGVKISQTFSARRDAKSGERWVQAVIRVEPHKQPLAFMTGQPAAGLTWQSLLPDVMGMRMTDSTCLLAPSESSHVLVFALGKTGHKFQPLQEQQTTARWPEAVTTQGQLSTKPDAHVVDTIPLPVSNPWKRNVRLADLDFLDHQGNAVAVTFDGDVWLVSGLKGDLESVTWKRFTSGLHEPMSIVVRPAKPQPEILVFDRNGIWKLIDSNQDGVCDRHEMFCNRFAQTAETREFPNSLKLGPNGALYIAKGGQEGTTRGKHNGTVIKVAPDGQSFEVLGYGLRQPFIGVHPQTGLVTASDQQGHYVPSTPLQIIENNQFYGHLPTIAPKEQYPAPIAEPLAWIPHPVNPSGASQTWLIGSRMGPIDGELIHVGYNRPELFRVVMNTRFTRPQAAVMSFSREFDFGPLNAKVNPADGQLYVAGFQVWGTTAKQLSGLSRVRYTGKPRVLLKEVTPMDKGLLLRFNAPLDPALATDPASYSAERWNYKRTAEYGSPHLKLDGNTGQEFLTPSSAYLSKDGLSVFVGIPDMRAGVHQMRIGWGLKSSDGLPANNTAYFSPWELASFDPKQEGFADLTVDLTPRAALATATVKASAAEGERVAQMFGCVACHSTDGSTMGKVGPSWKGLYGSERVIAKGMKGTVIADPAYLRESILSPSAKVVKGFEKFDTGMPIYAGILNDAQIESLILYIETLK
jgi:mono/diheme cytochrome c family protein